MAIRYLEDIIAKEYPAECKHLLADYSGSCRNLLSYDDWLKIYNVNPQIAEMRYKILCKQLNNEYKKKFNLSLNGKLAFLKHFWLNNNDQTLEQYVKDIAYMWDSDSYDGHDINAKEHGLRARWASIEGNIRALHDIYRNRFNDYDDDFIDYVIERIKKVPKISASERTSYGYRAPHSIEKYVYSINESIAKLMPSLEDLYSPDKRAIMKKLREDEEKRRIEERRVQKEQEYKQEYEKSLATWQKYIELLKANKAKKAHEFLLFIIKSDNSICYNYQMAIDAELAKFEKRVLGTKYTGDTSALSAERFAELAAEKVKYLL